MSYEQRPICTCTQVVCYACGKRKRHGEEFVTYVTRYLHLACYLALDLFTLRRMYDEEVLGKGASLRA